MMMVELCASLEPATSKQESQEQSRYLFLIRESGASLVEIFVIVITSSFMKLILLLPVVSSDTVTATYVNKRTLNF